MGAIEDIKQKIDIVAVIGQYTALAKAGRTFRGLCPFHSEKHGSFFVYPEQQSWHCFGACNTGGDVFSFIMKKEGVAFGEALRLLADKAGVPMPSKFERQGDGKERERLFELNQAAAQYFHNLLLNSPAGEKARGYVAKRGFSAKSIADFQLGYSLGSWEALKQYLAEKGYGEKELLTVGLVIEPESGGTHDRFRNRLMFPILDSRGRVTGFGARALDDSMPKYLNSPQTPTFDKSGSLYGINLAAPAIRQQDLVVVVEGYMDVIMAHQFSFSNVIASMGIAITDKQIGLLKRLTKHVTLALDPDEAGEEAMLKGVEYENTLEAEVKVMLLPEGKDPDEVIKEEPASWTKLVSAAVPVIDYTFNMVAGKVDLATAGGKSTAADRLMPIIARIKDDVRRDHYLNQLARLTGTQYRNLERALGRMRPDTFKGLRTAPATTRRIAPSSPVEQYVLSLLLQHAELRGSTADLPPEYFENSENREIYLTWREAPDASVLKERLDASMHDYMDTLLTKSLPGDNVAQKFADCSLRLREKFLRSLERKREQALALEAEMGGTAAQLAKLKEQGIDISDQLREVFVRKSQVGMKGGREDAGRP
ncbi:MAG: DNA primase [Chloroflexi bacterium]|nr:DNA primase [Chloroflexota bacterium]